MPLNHVQFPRNINNREDPSQFNRPSKAEMDCTNAGYFFNAADGKCYG